MDLLSEEEQWERFKAWLRNSAPSVLVMAALMVLAWFGWKWWQSHLEKQALAATAAYNTVVETFDARKNDEGYALVEALRSDFPDSPYVAAGDLIAANVHVTNNELDRAVERLQRVATTAKDEALRPIARLRLARVQAAQEQYDAALATLGTASMDLHEPARLEAHGDILFAKGDREGALKDYEAARALLPKIEHDDGGVVELLDLKIADLGGKPPEATTPAEPAAPAKTEAAP